MRRGLATSALLAIVGLSGVAQQTTARRIEPPAPAGEGGTLMVSVDRVLCAQDGLVLKVSRQDVDQPVARWHVLEAPVQKPCEWVVSDLWPGHYDVAVFRESPHQDFAASRFDMAAGTNTVQVLESSRTEVTGFLTIDGAPARDLQELQLAFTPTDQPNTRMEIPIDERGEYRGPLPFDGDVWVSVGGDRALITQSKRVKIDPGFNRFDVDFQAGVIKVAIVPPPHLSPQFRILCTVEYEAPRKNPRERPPVSKASRQIPMDATRAYVVIGRGYGRYVIRAGTDAPDERQSELIAEIAAELTPDQPRQDLTLDLSSASLTLRPYPFPMPHVEECPAPRTVACLDQTRHK